MKNQNKISHLFLSCSDLRDREKEILEHASKKLNFIPEVLMDRSSWWGSKEIGSFRYEGDFQGKKAVLKIQGIKPQTSEIYMIQSFARNNKSKILRPPLLYSFLSWDNEMRYEALVLEFVEGKKVELEEFFDLREEYKKNCTVNPWIDKPSFSLAEEIKINFEKWREASFKRFPTHLFRKPKDEKLIDNAVDLLIKSYRGVEPKFQHGHFSVNDLFKISEKEVVVLSNLYWSWKPPFYDAVFGYHWYIYNLANLKNITPELIEQQRNFWLSKINSLAKTYEDKELLNLAFLERAAAGLHLDALSVDPQSPIAEYLVNKTREDLMELIKKQSCV
ncbi:MAG: hypothetical protein Q7R51_01605 [bacterium]|nr:hypothetical protein [bacterium]